MATYKQAAEHWEKHAEHLQAEVEVLQGVSNDDQLEIKRLREALENVHNISCDNVDDRQTVHDVYTVSLKALKGNK